MNKTLSNYGFNFKIIPINTSFICIYTNSQIIEILILRKQVINKKALIIVQIAIVIIKNL